uniref:Uncharacterized protein n=1 Tax=Ditylum brightwellii TaxID=49249 RepID=A0A7S4RHU1_9STRA|mmetsp:Transcript_39060/g.58867  ORF Transcript_39060/g.58867 Transcript_39060/m.58867 type:complete len:209 (-) Transcript_39060:58-684(-)
MFQERVTTREDHVERNVNRAFGRRGDPRMHRAVAARQINPNMTLLDSLLNGGFEFPNLNEIFQSDRALLDTDGVSLFQRKNQLMRRLRMLKVKEEPPSHRTGRTGKIRKGCKSIYQNTNTSAPDELRKINSTSYVVTAPGRHMNNPSTYTAAMNSDPMQKNKSLKEFASKAELHLVALPSALPMPQFDPSRATESVIKLVMHYQQKDR